MLSPGQHHKRVPRDWKANLHFRNKILKLTSRDRDSQVAMKMACSEDLLFYVNAFVFQHNPSKVGLEVGPFITWGFQDASFLEILNHIEIGKDLLIEKSREMGASWMCLLIQDWLCRFHDNMTFLCISKSADAVESKSSSSLFWKLDFINRHLPDWMKAGYTSAKMHREYATGSMITGEASTGRAGVGGRATAAFIDEFSQIKEDFEVLQRTSDTTRCRIFNGTHMGTSTAFFELSQRKDMRKLNFHWTQHPDKIAGLYRYDTKENKVEVIDKQFKYDVDFDFSMDGRPTGGPHPGLRSPWYDEQCKRKGSARGIAMDLDIDPRGSSNQFFDPFTIKMLKQEYSRPAVWQGDLAYDRDTGKPDRLMKAAGGPIMLWFHPDVHGRPPGDEYALGADLATGTGATPSCFSIINSRGEQVLEYTDPNIEPTESAAYAVALCWLFKTMAGEGASLAWELQGPGLKFCNRVIELGYTNVYYKTEELAFYGSGKNTKPGWTPTTTSKRLLLEEYRSALAQRHLVIRSEYALDECLDFAYTRNGGVEHGGSSNDQDPSRARENHGDRVIASALAWMMVKSGVMDTKSSSNGSEVLLPGSLAWRREFKKQRQSKEETWA